jgi:phosphate transport system protein
MKALEHTDREYEQELRRLREQLLVMGSRVEDLIGGSLRALEERDHALAQRMIAADLAIDQLEVEVDSACLRILARRQPVASDLRLIAIALKVVTDLERMGDLGVNICERVMELSSEPALSSLLDLPRMAEETRSMLREALDALVARDAVRAQAVIERDHLVDALYAQLFSELLSHMSENPRNVYRAMRLASIGKYLERIADHATNVAEMVVFMVRGEDVRHLSGREGSSVAARH